MIAELISRHFYVYCNCFIGGLLSLNSKTRFFQKVSFPTMVKDVLLQVIIYGINEFKVLPQDETSSIVVTSSLEIQKYLIFLCFTNTSQKMKFSIKDFSSKREQIHGFQRIWLRLLEKLLMENFNFYAV